jgi:hypothetical protein
MTKQEIANGIAMEYYFWLGKKQEARAWGSDADFRAQFAVVESIRRRLSIRNAEWERGKNAARAVLERIRH